MCRQWSHLHKIREKSAIEYMKDSGVQLVNRYAEVKQRQKQVNDEFNTELETLEEEVLQFSEKEKIDVVFGSKNKVRIPESERLCFLSKYSKEGEQLEGILRKYGKFNDVSQLDTTALGEMINDKQWEPEVLKALKKYVEWENSIANVKK